MDNTVKTVRDYYDAGVQGEWNRMGGEKSMSLNNDIVKLLRQEGCDIVGFADLRVLSKEARQNFDYGILIALAFTKEAMAENKNGSPQRYSDEHDPMTRKLGELKELTAEFISDRGYEVLKDTPASVVDRNILRSLLPQKTVATLAGIGWIGRCAMLVTNEVGSALRLTVLLTNAPFDCGTPITKSLCPKNCTVCVDVCPGKAPLGKLWEAGVDRDEFFNAHACQTAAHTRAKSLLGIDDESRCGLCVSNCPFTKRGLGYE